MNRRTWLTAIVALAIVLPAASIGHHTFAYTYNTSQVAEIAGEVIEVRWENPHVQFRMRTEDGEIWSIESNSPAGMQRRGIYPGMISAGSRFRLAGFPARDGGNGMHASNILLRDGTEIVLRPGSKPRFSSHVLRQDDPQAALFFKAPPDAVPVFGPVDTGQ
ncbi:MAG: DUF6152 family protein [Rhodospirillaceae bacterium]|nr:DUF6152 family protein [Rhodospirillaceae bacterium]